MSRRMEELANERSYANGRRDQIIERAKSEHGLYHNLNEHVALYRLMEEYDSISDDIDKCKNASTKSLLSRRLEEIKKRLQNDFVVYDLNKKPS